MILFFLYFLGFSINKNIYSPVEVINYFNEEIVESHILEEIKNKVSILLNDFYAFYEISKNPPQPNFDNNYHNKVDLKKEINDIQTNNTSYYKFYQDFNKALTKTRDGHFYFDVFDSNKFLKQFTFLSPLKLYIISDNGTIKIVGKNNVKPEYYSKYKNHEIIFDIIDKNENTTIRSIKGKDPFDFISEFGSNYMDFRSPHANLAFKFILTDVCYLSVFPLSIEDLTNFTVVYENNDIFTTDYIIESDVNIYEDQTDNILLKQSPEPIVEKKIFFHDKFEILQDLQKNSEILLNDNRIIKQRSLLEEENIEIKWDYNYSTIFKCRVDKENEINVYYINSFYGNDTNTFVDTIVKCLELFDTNKYPITFISNLNGGGYLVLSQLLLETISPYINTQIYTSLRKTDFLFKYFESSKEKVSWYNDCKFKSLKELYEKGKTIDYGNNITDTISDLFYFDGYQTRVIYNSIKKVLENKRKPNDIVIIADGFSFSATSIFLKYLRYYGGGITVGIFPHPNKPNIPFDNSLSPSAIFTHEELLNLSSSYKKLNKDYKLIMQKAGYQTFYNHNQSIPLEYVITPVDEIEPFYEYLTNKSYEQYIQIAKNKINKYKKQCNPENKKLVQYNKECDNNFENEYTHGGYECGDDGVWSTKCVAAYCDIGFKFDPITRKCSFDKCSINQKLILIYFIVTIIGLIISFIVVIVIVILMKIKKNKNELDYKDISKISLSIQERN